MFQCVYCNYASIHKHNVTKHVKRMHANNTAPSTTINAHPTQLGSGNIIQEPIKINDASYNEPLHNIQYGSGSTVIPIEKYNEAVESAFSWKNNCEKLEEDNYVKDQSVKNRDGQLQNQNIKLQDEFVKNNNLHVDYHNSLEKSRKARI